MKIMSYIQKTIYALFLLALFSGCTDEVLDGGGGTNVPMIEDGTLVNVGIALDGSMAKTVVTRSMDDDDEPEVDDDLVILQYKGENLVHAWYTDREFEDGHGDYKELEGWGQQTPVKNIKLLSGSGYKVFVIANLNLDENDDDGDDDGDDVGSYYSPITITDGNRTYERDEIDDKRGSILLTANKNKKFQEHFRTLSDLRSWQLSKLNKKSNPDDDDVMLAVVNNGAMDGVPNSNYSPYGDKVYRYTKMLTNVSNATNINDVIAEAPDVKITGDTEADDLCATLYQPYAMISLKIVGSDNLDKNVRVRIESVKIKNCPTDYTLVNGYKLNGKGVDAFFSKKDDGDDDYDTYDSSKDAFAGETIKKGKTIIPRSKDDNACVFVYENMAGSLTDKTNPHGDGSKEAVSNYTYIEVVGEINSKPITYRFILGKDRKNDCNVERNVHYNVTMTLTGDGGVNNTTWEVVYQKEEEGDKKFSVDASALLRLDAHATISPIVFKNLQPGTYILKKNGKGYLRNHGASIYDVSQGVTLVSQSGNNLEFRIDRFMSEVTINYRQDSWFYEDGSTFIGSSNEHNRYKPEDVAKADCNEFVIDVCYENVNNVIGQIEVKQYPPIVVSFTHLFNEFGNEDIKMYPSGICYMERFLDDKNFTGGELWKKRELTNSSYDNWDERMCTPVHDEKYGSIQCYWYNAYGPLTGRSVSLKRKSSTDDDSWECYYDNENIDKDTERYIIQN